MRERGEIYTTEIKKLTCLFMCMCSWVEGTATVHMWKPGDNLWELVRSFFLS